MCEWIMMSIAVVLLLFLLVLLLAAVVLTWNILKSVTEKLK